MPDAQFLRISNDEAGRNFGDWNHYNLGCWETFDQAYYEMIKMFHDVREDDHEDGKFYNKSLTI